MIDQQYKLAASEGLLNFWQQGDAVSHLVLLLLLTMSILSWTQICIKIFRKPKQKKLLASLENFWQAKDLDEAISSLSSKLGNNHPITSLAKETKLLKGKMDEGKIEKGLGNNLTINDFVTRALRQKIAQSTVFLESGLTTLASIGSVSPFVGLFGTVYGIYHALLGIAKEGNASLNTVSGPVGEALIMTAIGLFVAIPSIIAYNSFVRMNRLELSELDGFAHDLHSYLLTGTKKI